MVKKYRAELKRMLAAAWAMGKALVWVLELVRDKGPESERLGEVVCAILETLVLFMKMFREHGPDVEENVV
jgi:hypothetical protein